MSEFTKPVETYISDKEYIEKLVNASLRKDLHDDEEICQICHGTGLVIINNPFGLSDDADKQAGMFPYQHQSISFCQHCYNVIVHRCKHCGKIISRSRTKHDCEIQRNIDANLRKEKEANNLENAPLATEEVLKLSDYFYSDSFGNNEGFFDDWDEFFDYWNMNSDPEDIRPEYVWATAPTYLHIEGYDIVDQACEDMYEDAISNISNEEFKELQNYLDKWCDTCGVGPTYCPTGYKVKIPWESSNER